MIDVPILFLVFNRPDTTEQVFKKIREAKPPRLYVAADGPRGNKVNEDKQCEEARQIATNIDWECEVKTLFRDKNLGCKLAVSRGIDWFFENEEMGIILEDDCEPNTSFFQFCEELLHKYKEVDKIMTISGNNFQPNRRTENSYYFSKYMHCWGWASWRRAWQKFDLKMDDWPLLKEGDFLSEIFNSKSAESYWERIFDRVYAGEIDSWAYIWTYSIWKENGVNILPEKNLVSNIGFREDGTHTKSSDSESANLSTLPLEFPLKHPSKINIQQKADRYTQRNVYSLPFWKKLSNKLLKLVGNVE